MNRFLLKLLWQPSRKAGVTPRELVLGSEASRLSVLSLIAALGVLIVALSYSASRIGLEVAMTLFWVGLVVVFAPAFARLFAPDLGRSEAAILLIILGIASCAVAFLRTPRYFSGFDELLHWRTAYDILQSGRLFTPNELLPVSPFFPGLENATTAVSNLTGLPIMPAAMLTLVVCRVVAVLGLFLLFERVSGSTNVGAVGVAVYMGASVFMFFDVQFGYESLAIPLVILSMNMTAAMSTTSGRNRWAWFATVFLVNISLIAAHHLTTYLLVAYLVVWSVADMTVPRVKVEQRLNPLPMAVMLAIGSLVWVTWIARPTLRYLASPIDSMITAVGRVIMGTGGTRQLFVNEAGEAAALFEPVVGVLSVLILGFSLLLGLWEWWTNDRRNVPAIMFAVCAAAFPALPLLRLSPTTWEAGNRLTATVFIALGFVVASGYVRSALLDRVPFPRQFFLVPFLIVILFGGVIGGSSPQTRLPAPYRAAADARSIDDQVLAAADWARTRIGVNNRMAADRISTSIMGSYGGQRMVVNQGDNVTVSGLFLSYTLDVSSCRFVQREQIRYIVIDKRIATVLPLFGFYFEQWEALEVNYEFIPPVNIATLEKFDNAPGVSRLYDSGDIVIYDVGNMICE